MTNVNIFFKRRLGIGYPNKSQLLLVVLLFLISISTFAQGNTTIVKGIVTDEITKERLIGASVTIKGTIIGAITDINGEFQFSTNQELPVTIFINSIGYRNQEIDVYENEPLSINLSEDLNRLSEVVVVGYGTRKREELTGSISSIPLLSVKSAPAVSVERLLQGNAPGVQVTQTSGQPGGASTIRIRGGNSILGSNEPLYVIDGFPIYNDASATTTGALSGQGVSPLSTINTNDIESIDVLKDASATAIYGSRGANGVVIITTKKGRTGESVVNYDNYFGVQKVSKTLDLLNAQQFAELRNEARFNTDPTQPPYYTANEIANLQTTDWQNAIFKEAFTQSHNLSFTGGNDKTHFLASGNYLSQDGILNNTGFERFAGRLNLDHKLYKNFTIGATVSVSNVESKQARDGIVRSAIVFPPDLPVKDQYGKYTPYNSLGATINPAASLDLETNESNTFRFLGNFFAEYKITSDLVAKVSFGSDVLNTKQNRYLPSTIYDGNTTHGSASVGVVNYTSWLNENTLNYTKQINDNHKIEILGGYTTQKWGYEKVLAKANGFLSDITTYNSLQSGSLLVAPSSSEAVDVLNSYLGRINYSLYDKYLFTASLRADGHSPLGANNKWGYFPSAAIAWNVNKESFISQIKTISNLKVRLSAGETGNSQLDPYSSLTQLLPYQYIFNNALTTGLSPSNIANPDLKWERTAQYNGGIDIGLYDNRLSLNADLYYKKTSDLLVPVPIPVSSGFQTSVQNLGTVENKGIELYLTAQIFKSKRANGFNWTTNVSYSVNKNEILDLGGAASLPVDGGNERTVYNQSILKVGEPVGAYYGYVATGIDQYGRPTYEGEKFDASNPNKAGVLDPNSRKVLGSSQPDFIAGFTNTLSYKGFDLNIFFQGVYGNELLNYLKIDLTQVTGFGNASTDVLNRWTPTNTTNATQPKAVEQQSVVFSDNYIEDGSYIRLKTLTLGYTLPSNINKILHVKKLRLYVTGQNLFTITNYTGYDPEVSRYQQSSLFSGYDYGEYPNYRTYLAGLNLTF